MVKVIFSNGHLAERKYIINCILGEYLGIQYYLDNNREDNQNQYDIVLDNGNILTIQDYFFCKFNHENEYLNSSNIPQKIAWANNKFTSSKFPIIYGENYIEIQDNEHKRIKCSIDIFASIYFMLSRWEEYANKARDDHDRFPASACLSYRFGFLDHPVVDEYVDFLWQMLLFLGYKEDRKQYVYSMKLTHDVDEPFELCSKSNAALFRNIVGDVLKRKDYRQASKKIRLMGLGDEARLPYDRYFTFDYIMDQSEKRGLKSAFYFLPNGSPEQSSKINIENKLMVKLLKSISKRGHEIGIHGHYDTYDNEEAFIKDVEKLRRVLEINGIYSKMLGGRQHYLRWKSPTTYYNYVDAGLSYDSTLSYADVAGFRCGTCHEFQPFDFIERKQLNIVERPLIAMECSVIDERYMNLGYTEKALEYFKKLKDECRKHNGNFVLLWHNSRLRDENEKRFYEQVLAC